MKVSVTKPDALKRQLKFEVSRERVTETLNEVYQEIMKVAKVKGFRPGNVPRHIVEREYGSYAREEALKHLIPAVYKEGITQEKLQPLDLPNITDVEFKDGAVTFTASIDTKPEVRLSNYKRIPVRRKSPVVTDEDLNKAGEFFQKSHGRENVPLDDAFVRGLGYPDVESFRTSVRRQLEEEKERQGRRDIEVQVIDALLQESKLVVPPVLVREEVARRMQAIRERLHSQGMAEEEITKREEDIRKNLQPAAEKDVKVFLILEAIRAAEGIEIKKEEEMTAKVMEFLLREADWQG